MANTEQHIPKQRVRKRGADLLVGYATVIDRECAEFLWHVVLGILIADLFRGKIRLLQNITKRDMNTNPYF